MRKIVQRIIQTTGVQVLWSINVAGVLARMWRPNAPSTGDVHVEMCDVQTCTDVQHCTSFSSTPYRLHERAALYA
jgi:hypothetical protein